MDTRRQESLAGVLITTGLYEAEPSEVTANTLSQGCLHFKRSQCWLLGGTSSTTTGGVRAILKTKGLRSLQTPCHGQSIWIQEHFCSPSRDVLHLGLSDSPSFPGGSRWQAQAGNWRLVLCPSVTWNKSFSLSQPQFSQLVWLG